MTNGHPYEDADYDLYALGALRGEENAAIESHAASCQECAQKLAQARGRIALLALAVDPVEPSPGVKESLMRQLMASAEGHETWQRPEEPHRVRYRATRWWTAIWAPAAVAFACITIFLVVENRKLDQQLDGMRADVAQLQSQVQDTEANVALFSAKDTVRVALAPSKDFRGTSASVRYNARLGKAFYSDSLSTPAPPDKSYQLWLVPADGKPISAGILNPTSGTGSEMFVSVPPNTQAKAFAVTEEPLGGSPQPTGPKILVGGL
jgi:anti-sigma-K factor RskA